MAGATCTMMLLAAIGALLAACRVPRAARIVLTATLTLSTVGYLLFTQVRLGCQCPDTDRFRPRLPRARGDRCPGTDLVVGAAPPEKADSASAMSDTVQELGLALGVAILGSLATAVCRSRIAGPRRHTLRGGRRGGRRPHRRGLVGIPDARRLARTGRGRPPPA
ncbi:hypothetical protein GCM10009716_47950 [Streptomyces sodiiphilus]|uniref:Integral membrane protein n=1 Tax=Streptomyces sodiiphilus TaxID=226217 RepID=A0ABN2PZ85_9ACTN